MHYVLSTIIFELGNLLGSYQVPGEPGWRVAKLLSVDPANYEDAPREGIRRILEEVVNTVHPATL